MKKRISLKMQLTRIFTTVVLTVALIIGAVGYLQASDIFYDSYIVQGRSTDQVLSLVNQVGGKVTARLDVIKSVSARLSTSSVATLLNEPAILGVTKDVIVETAGKKGGNSTPATDYPDVIGAELVWNQGTVGNGVGVAVVDTGLGWHTGLFKDINGRVQGRIVGWKDFIENTKLPQDPNGHGTHIAGIIANTEMGSDQEWNGVAPGVNLIGVRVLNKEGYGSYTQVIQGIEWVIKNKNKYNIRVMNLSLVSSARTPYWSDPLNQAVMKAWAEGIVVVVAAGNDGPKPMTIGVPGNNPYVITVGAFTDTYTPNDWNDDTLATFSAAGPTLDGFVKPDLVAPGAHMVSSMMPSSYLSKNREANRISSQYFSMAGTSQAAAVVSGVSALILSQHPELTPDGVKYRLLYTALPWVDSGTTEAGYSIWQQGAGRVNAPDAVTADIAGLANVGMDIQADLAGVQHYEGYSYYDESVGQYRLRGDYSGWDGKYWVWDGGFGAWSGGFGAWSGGFGAWSGGFGAWSGGFGAWSGGFGAWSGGFGAWSGGFGAWSGGFGAWSGGFGAWSGSEPWAGSVYADPAFVNNFLAGSSVNSSTTTAIGKWVEEP